MVHAITTIDPLTTSYQQLKAMVGRTDGQRLPNAKTLEDSEEEVVFRYECGDEAITVYRNGFFIYESNGRKTVCAVDRCRRLVYRYLDDEIRAIEEWQYATGPCIVPLLIKGDERLEHNRDSVDWYWHEFSLSFEADSRLGRASIPSEEERYILEEDAASFQRRLDTLTTRQREVLSMYYDLGMTPKQISAALHIARQNVEKYLAISYKKLKN